MHRADSQNDDACRRVRARRDRGQSFVEVLVSIVLLGTAVIGVLTAVRTTIIATSIQSDQAKTQQWLQSAAEAIEAMPFPECNPSLSNTANRDATANAYRFVVQTVASKPDELDDYTIDIGHVPNVWNGAGFVAFSAQDPLCYDDVLLRQHLVTIVVTDSGGDIVKSMEVVKRDRAGG